MGRFSFVPACWGVRETTFKLECSFMELQGAGSDWVLTLTQGAITPARKSGLDFSSDWETLELSRPVQPNGVVCNIFVKVRQDQKQLEHPVSLLRIGIGGAFLEIFDDGQCIS
jgi:hypothetical protein